MSDLVKRLEPCPFCGGEAAVLGGKFPLIGIRYGVNCRGECGTFLDAREVHQSDAIRAWNGNRPRLRSEIERRDLQLEVASKAALKLADEVERLTRERDEARAGWKTASELLDAAVGDYNTEHDALTTLTARTREVLAAMMQALRSIDTRATVPHGDATPGPMGSDNFMHDLRWIADTAREAMTTANTLFNELKETKE